METNNHSNTKRVLFWLGFVVVLVLIIWGLIVAMNKPTTGSTLGTPAPVTAADHIRGSVNAPVTLIEYGDFQCPACGAYYPIVEKVFNESSSTMRMVFRHFPLSQHPNAIPAALAAEAASKQGKFWEMYALLYSNQADWSDLADPTHIFDGYAATTSLDLAKFHADIADPATKQIITDEQNEGIHLGINATPTFFINGKAITNPQSYAEFKADIDAAASSTTQ